MTPKRAAMAATVGAGAGELGERDHLVGRVHGEIAHVLRERELLRIAVRGDLAGHGVIGVQRSVLGERLQRGEAASAGDDGEALDPVRVRRIGAGDEVLEKPVRLDGGQKLGLSGLVGAGSCARSRARARAGRAGCPGWPVRAWVRCGSWNSPWMKEPGARSRPSPAGTRPTGPGSARPRRGARAPERRRRRAGGRHPRRGHRAAGPPGPRRRRAGARPCEARRRCRASAGRSRTVRVEGRSRPSATATMRARRGL